MIDVPQINCGTCGEPFILTDHGYVHACPDSELDRLRRECAEAYMVVGALADMAEVFETDAVEKVLDNLSAASHGDKRVHDEVLPFRPRRPLFFARLRSAWRVIREW